MTQRISGDPLRTGLQRTRLAWVLLATAVACSYLLFWGWGTLPTLGDEARHFRRARNYYEAPFHHFRVTHDPVYGSKEAPGAFLYFGGPLWHMVLALLWKAIGQPSAAAAQIYHTGLFFVLAIFTYLTGRELYGHGGGLWAWGLAITIPMNILFGMVFYLEIPMLALGAVALYFLTRRNAVAVGLALAGMYLTKSPTAAILIPPILVAAVFALGDTWRKRLLRTSVAVGMLVLVLLPDFAWHTKHFGEPVVFYKTLHFYPEQIRQALAQLPDIKRSSIPFSIFDPVDDLKMFGATGLVALGLATVLAVAEGLRLIGIAFAQVRHRGLRRGLCSPALRPSTGWLINAPPLLFYVLVYAAILRGGSCDPRYFQPTTLFACLLTGGLLAAWRPFRRKGRAKWVVRAAAVAIILAMAVQFVAVPPKVRKMRLLDPRIKAAYTWIRNHTPPHARFLYLEENLTALTGRPIIWASASPRLLFTAEEAMQVQLLADPRIQYIAIHPTRRIQHWTPETEPSAYPQSWIDTLPGRGYLVRVYPLPEKVLCEKDFVIYRVDYERIPREWIDNVQPGPGKHIVEEERRGMEEGGCQEMRR